jgi:hypothetical protein
VGIWDGGIPRLTHQEFGARITVRDGSAVVRDHANHVAGTVGAVGINPLIKGMAPGVLIDAYDFSFDLLEMTNVGASALSQAGNLYISNHSYGPFLGWGDPKDGIYTWYGKFTDNGNPADDVEDDFGKYSSTTASLSDPLRIFFTLR